MGHMVKTRILVAGGKSLYCDALSALFSSSSDLEVVAKACSGKEALEKAREQHPDVLLMDAALPAMDGVEASEQLRRENFAARVLLFVDDENKDDVLTGFRSGVNGFVSKKATYDEIVSAISSVRRGDYLVHFPIAKSLFGNQFRGVVRDTGQTEHSKLTLREMQVLKLVAEGYRTIEIAKLLKIAEKTVVAHRTRLMRKLGLHRQIELVRYALRRHLIDVDS